MILDTCGLLAWLYTPDVLSPESRRLVRLAVAAGSATVCAISAWEIAWKHLQGKLPLPGGLDGFEAAFRASSIASAATDHRLWMVMARLDWAHRDPADRLIVSLARDRGVPILTSDATIAAFHATLW